MKKIIPVLMMVLLTSCGMRSSVSELEKDFVFHEQFIVNINWQEATKLTKKPLTVKDAVHLQ